MATGRCQSSAARAAARIRCSGIFMSSEAYFATCARGLEPLVASELAGLKAENIKPGQGGVAFRGERSTLYLANLWLRTAIRILMPVLEAHVESGDDLYHAV